MSGKDHSAKEAVTGPLRMLGLQLGPWGTPIRGVGLESSELQPPTALCYGLLFLVVLCLPVVQSASQACLTL